jgi:co-chaperonin GroES (HSP10)
LSFQTFSIHGIEPLKSVVLVRDMEHGDVVTKGGLIIPDDDGKDRGIHARLCTVYKVGREVDYLKPGDRILVSHGRWTRGVKMNIDGDQFIMHMVDNKDILTIVED